MSTTSTSTARPERQRLMPLTDIILFGALVLGSLLALHAGSSLQQRLETTALADPLSIAYLNAWLQAAPDDDRLRLILAQRERLSGELDTALVTLAPLLDGRRRGAASSNGALLEAETLLLDILSQQLWRKAPGTPGFAAARTQVLRQMDRLATLPLDPAQYEQYANQAIALQAPAQALRFYRRLLQTQPYETVRIRGDIAALYLQQGLYRDAAQIYFMNMERAMSLAERRRHFTAALRALQAGNLLDEAMAAAAQRGRGLMNDPPTLEFLTRLARAANRPDLAEYYVVRLLRLPPAPVQDAEAQP
ncbi:MAG: pelB [Moraxellaceae bacterium]|nr:pelB [Moraxellaceae bacterium]